VAAGAAWAKAVDGPKEKLEFVERFPAEPTKNIPKNKNKTQAAIAARLREKTFLLLTFSFIIKFSDWIILLKLMDLTGLSAIQNSIAHKSNNLQNVQNITNYIHNPHH